jgi:hypothetical protein
MMTQNESRYRLSSNPAGGTDVDLEMQLALKWNLPAFMIKKLITDGINSNLEAIKRIAETG